MPLKDRVIISKIGQTINFITFILEADTRSKRLNTEAETANSKLKFVWGKIDI